MSETKIKTTFTPAQNFAHGVQNFFKGSMLAIDATERCIIEPNESKILYWKSLREILDGENDGSIPATSRHNKGEQEIETTFVLFVDDYFTDCREPEEAFRGSDFTAEAFGSVYEAIERGFYVRNHTEKRSFVMRLLASLKQKTAA